MTFSNIGGEKDYVLKVQSVQVGFKSGRMPVFLIKMQSLHRFLPFELRFAQNLRKKMYLIQKKLMYFCSCFIFFTTFASTISALALMMQGYFVSLLPRQYESGNGRTSLEDKPVQVQDRC